MPIPKDILAVERPKNTVVIAYGKNKDRYAVRQKIGCRRVDDRNLPVNGPIIGHIVDGIYDHVRAEIQIMRLSAGESDPHSSLSAKSVST